MPTRSHGPDAGSHDTHDRLLVAALAAGDLIEPELDRAGALLATCPDCRALHAELLAIAAATHHLPAPVRPVALDFRISPDKAAELTRGGLLRRLLRPFGRSGSGAVRPLAAAFTTLGIAGLMLATLPNLQLGGSSAGAGYLSTIGQAVETAAPAYAPAGSPAPEIGVPGDAMTLAPIGRDTSGEESSIDTSGDSASSLPTEYAQGALPSSTANTRGSGSATASPRTAGDRLTFAVSDDAGGPSPLLVLSVALLGIGLGLFLVRGVALRRR